MNISRVVKINRLLAQLKEYLEKIEEINRLKGELLVFMRDLEMESRRWDIGQQMVVSNALEVANLGLNGQCFQDALDELEASYRRVN